MVIYENLPLVSTAIGHEDQQRLLMPPPSEIPRIPPPPSSSSNRPENGHQHSNYHHQNSSSLYVCSAEVRSRKRYGICGGAGSAELPLTPKKNNNNSSSVGSNNSCSSPPGAGGGYFNYPHHATHHLHHPHHHHPLPLLHHETALQIWLQELQSLTEVESLTALQAKSVATTPESFEALSIRNAQVAIQAIRRQSSAAIDELDCLLDCLPVSVEGLAYLHESFSGSTAPAIATGADFATNTATRTADVMAIVEQTRNFMATFIRRGSGTVVNNAQIEATVRRLREAFGELVDVTLKKECALLVGSLQAHNGGQPRRPRSHLCLKWSLLALWQLTQKDPYMVRLLIEQQQNYHHQNGGGIIESLLEIVQHYEGGGGSGQEATQIKAAALRVLTYLSSNREAVRAILRALSPTSSSTNSQTPQKNSTTTTTSTSVDEGLLKEAVGLLVQLTTPFIDSKEQQQQQHKHSSWDDADCPLAPKSLINELVAVLTDIARRNSSSNSGSNGQIFLMTAAALANITFLSTETLVKYETLGVLVGAARQLRQHHQQQQNNFNYQRHHHHHHHYHHHQQHQQSSEHLLQDQIITLLANMAAKHPLEVVSSGGLIYLLDALLHDEEEEEVVEGGGGGEMDFENSTTPPPTPTTPTTLPSTLIAPACAKIILKLGGIAKLVRLCKCPAERAHSDTVLLAAIAALKRLATAVGRKPFHELGATDLVDEKLQASFQAYSSMATAKAAAASHRRGIVGPSCESLV
ncbi:hypothetical protein TYRP_002627 [Tyrophagus putrescentiae]|nr:hypothetical protein TYRP_002627 [Tyrophagus putrescentiae]